MRRIIREGFIDPQEAQRLTKVRQDIHQEFMPLPEPNAACSDPQCNMQFHYNPNVHKDTDCPKCGKPAYIKKMSTTTIAPANNLQKAAIRQIEAYNQVINVEHLQDDGKHTVAVIFTAKEGKNTTRYYEAFEMTQVTADDHNMTTYTKKTSIGLMPDKYMHLFAHTFTIHDTPNSQARTLQHLKPIDAYHTAIIEGAKALVQGGHFGWVYQTQYASGNTLWKNPQTQDTAIYDIDLKTVKG